MRLRRMHMTKINRLYKGRLIAIILSTPVGLSTPTLNTETNSGEANSSERRCVKPGSLTRLNLSASYGGKC